MVIAYPINHYNRVLLIVMMIVMHAYGWLQLVYVKILHDDLFL